MSFSFTNINTLKHLAMGLGVAGVAFYLSQGTQMNLNDLASSIPSADELKQSFASNKSQRKRD
jgi:hypothetical protein